MAEKAIRDAQGLCDDANLEVFLTWWAFGGQQRGISPMEAADMPLAMRKDFLLILDDLHKDRKRRDAFKKKKKR